MYVSSTKESMYYRYKGDSLNLSKYTNTDDMESAVRSWAITYSTTMYSIDNNDNGQGITASELFDRSQSYVKKNPSKGLSTKLLGEKYYFYCGNAEFKSILNGYINEIKIKEEKEKMSRNYSSSSSNNKSNKISTSKDEKINYDESTRNDLKALSNKLNDKYLTTEQKQNAIREINNKYSLSIPLDATGADVSKMATSNTGGIIGEIGNKISYYTKGSGIADVFNKSRNEYVAAFTDEGITGDILWGVITGKYNKDQKAKEDLLKLSEDINNGNLSEEEKVKRLAKLNRDYGLNISENVTVDEINEIIKSNQSMEYKKKVSEIAKGLIEQKINDEINKQLEKRLGPVFRSLGINFNFKDRNIIRDIRDIIRGTKKIEIDQEAFVRELEKRLTEKIDKLIDEQVNKQIDRYANDVKKNVDKVADEALKQIDVYRKKVDSVNDKIEGWVKNPDRFRTLIADKLDSLVKTPTEKIAGVLDNLDNKLKGIGLGNIGLGKMFRTMSNTFMKGVAEKIRVAVQPVLTKALTITKTIQENIKKAMDKINELRNKAKEMVDKWKNTLKDAIKEQTKKIVNHIVQYVKLNLSNLGGAFNVF